MNFLIGVKSRVDQKVLIAEFFELFKTPWEFCQPGHSYDAVITTTPEIPVVKTRLLIVYGAASDSFDANLGIVAQTRGRGGLVSCREMLLPIYGELLTFNVGSKGNPFMMAGQAAAGLNLQLAAQAIVRVGYDVFDELRCLLSEGQPPEHAPIPTLDLHIQMLRNWILTAGIPLLEISPTPAGRDFIVCLTHDIDFAGIRRHFCDHTMWGFVYRATIGAIRNAVRGRLSLSNLLRCWVAVASLPFVFVGWVDDFWDPFSWYLAVEKGLPATYFLIPFKRRAGQKVAGPHPSRRAAAYDVEDLPQWTKILLQNKCELGVHGLDAWHSAEKGREELDRITAVTGEPSAGIRMHWLLGDSKTPSTLENGGFAYDSTWGYNETIGYRAGTNLVFRLMGTRRFLELPLHIQDGALFFPDRLNLSETEAEQRCQSLVENAKRSGGVLTLLWHDRSHAPERFWGGFYSKLVKSLRSLNVWFGTGAEVVNWFAERREVRFEVQQEPDGSSRISLRYEGKKIEPLLNLRIYRVRSGESSDFIDIPWDGKSAHQLEQFQKAIRAMHETPAHAESSIL